MKSATDEFEWGVVVNFEKKEDTRKNPAKDSAAAMLYVHTLLYVLDDASEVRNGWTKDVVLLEKRNTIN